MVSLEGQSEQSKQSLVAPGVRGELFEGEQCVLRKGWNGVSGALSLYRYLWILNIELVSLLFYLFK